ncbi:nitroreductase family protein [Kytococcus sp. Marseille-QA3725]
MNETPQTPVERVLARRDDWQRAPSAHNTQPWLVTAAGPDRLVIGWEAARTLPMGDPTRRDLMLSLGCVAEALAVVAADEGLAAQVDWQVDRATRVAGTVTLQTAGPPSRAGAEDAPGEPADVAERAGADLAALRERRTARGRHVAAPGPAEVQALAEQAGVGAVLLPRDLVDRLLPVADRWNLEGPAADELNDWMRLDPRDPRHGQDGLSAAALGLGRLEAAGLRRVLHPRVAPWLRRARVMRVLARFSTVRPVGTVVGVLGPAGSSDEDVAELGQELLRFWLAAHRAGWSAHPLSQLLDCPQTAAEVEGLVPGQRVLTAFRLGRPQGTPVRSARLTDR